MTLGHNTGAHKIRVEGKRLNLSEKELSARQEQPKERGDGKTKRIVNGGCIGIKVRQRYISTQPPGYHQSIAHARTGQRYDAKYKVVRKPAPPVPRLTAESQ